MPSSSRRKIIISLALFTLVVCVVVIYEAARPKGGIIIEIPEANYSVATGIDDEGQVLGSFFSREGNIQFFTWTPEKGMTPYDKSTQSDKSPFEPQTNSLGQKIENTEVNGEQHAFIVTKGGGKYKLPLLGGNQSYAYAINNKGQAVGFIKNHTPWWKEKWNELADRLGLPFNVMLSMSHYNSPQAALWTVPPEEE